MNSHFLHSHLDLKCIYLIFFHSLSLSELLLDNMCCFAHEKHYFCKTSLLQFFWFVLIRGTLVLLTSTTLHYGIDQMISVCVIIISYRFCLLAKR